MKHNFPSNSTECAYCGVSRYPQPSGQCRGYQIAKPSTINDKAITDFVSKQLTTGALQTRIKALSDSAYDVLAAIPLHPRTRESLTSSGIGATLMPCRCETCKALQSLKTALRLLRAYQEKHKPVKLSV